MTFYPSLYTEAVQPDIVEEKGGEVYLGWIDRHTYDRSQDPEGQAIWKIRKVTSASIDGGTRTMYLYPNGDFSHAYSWAEKESYNYKFRN